MIVGNNPHRLQENDSYYADEVLFNRLFNEMMEQYPSFWNYMTGSASDGKSFKSELTEKELKIVASTIQWLGTPIGKQFLEKAGFRKC